MANFAGYEIDFPFGPAAGTINGVSRDEFVEHMHQVLHSAAGFGLGGTTTMEGGPGNAAYGRTYYHNRATGETVNSMGLPSIGIAGIEEVMPELRKIADDKGKPVGVSVASAKGEDPVKVFPELVERAFLAGAHFVEANYSCPNQITDGGDREPILSYDIEMVEIVRAAIIARIGIGQYFGEKWAPPIMKKENVLRRLANGLWVVQGVYYVAGPNTIPNQELFDEKGQPALDVPGNRGGLSGPAARGMGRKTAERLKEWLPPQVKHVSAMGVDSGAEIFHRVNTQGADLASGVTVYFENEAKGKDYRQTSNKLADEYFEAVQAA